MDSQVSFLLKQHFTPGLVGTSTQWARCPGDVLIRGPNWPSGFLLTPRSVELRQKAPLKVPHCTCEAKSLEEPHFSRWYPQPGPFESLPPEHVIADKGHGVNQELRLPARPFATVAVVKHLHCHRRFPKYPVHLLFYLDITQKSTRPSRTWAPCPLSPPTTATKRLSSFQTIWIVPSGCWSLAFLPL